MSSGGRESGGAHLGARRRRDAASSERDSQLFSHYAQMDAQSVLDYPLCHIRKRSSIHHRFGIRPAALQIRYSTTASNAAVIFVCPHLHWRALPSALRALHRRGSDKYIHRELDSSAVFSLKLSDNNSSQAGASSSPAALTASQLPSAAADPNVAPVRSGRSRRRKQPKPNMLPCKQPACDGNSAHRRSDSV